MTDEKKLDALFPAKVNLYKSTDNSFFLFEFEFTEAEPIRISLPAGLAVNIAKELVQEFVKIQKEELGNGTVH